MIPTFSASCLLIFFLTQLKFTAPSAIDLTTNNDATDLFTLDGFANDTPAEENTDIFNLNFPSYSNPQDQSLTSSTTEELSASEGEICPMGKKRDGTSCAPPPSTLELPNLGIYFGIDSESESNRDRENKESVSGLSWNWADVVDPCQARLPYNKYHLCCHGVLGRFYGNGYTFIENCVLGVLFSLLPPSSFLPSSSSLSLQRKRGGDLGDWGFWLLDFSCSNTYLFLGIWRLLSGLWFWSGCKFSTIWTRHKVNDVIKNSLLTASFRASPVYQAVLDHLGPGGLGSYCILLR